MWLYPKTAFASVRGTLDGDSICLNSQCLSEGFVEKEGAKVTIAKANGKAPRKVLVPGIQEYPILLYSEDVEDLTYPAGMTCLRILM